MSRKDYIAIAHALSGLGDTVSKREVVAALSDVLRNDNPRFNRERFETACGVSQNEDRDRRAA